MCGRFSVSTDPKMLAKRFDAELPLEGLTPRYNAAPSQNLPIINNEETNKIQLYRWGLIPFWAKDPNIGNRMINARSETLADKPSFRNPLNKKRCLVLADGFYEWKKSGKNKIPIRITLKSGNPFAFAGLWDQWKNPDGNILYSFTIITTQANDMLIPIHERMPVILSPDSEKNWLNNNLNQNDWLDLLKPYPEDEIKFYPVSIRINSPSNDDPSLLLSA